MLYITVELGDYLEIMSEFREERFEAYCDYCEGCLKNYYQTWIKSQGGRDLKEFSDASWRDDIKDNKDFEAHRALGGCAGMDSCQKYKNICGGGISSDYEDYFECTEVERNNGQSVFVGPHCAADGYTVALGVYGDEYCNEYIGNGVNIQNVLGEKLDDNYLVEYVSGSVEALNQMHEVYPEYGWCIPCKQQVRSSLQEVSCELILILNLTSDRGAILCPICRINSGEWMCSMMMAIATVVVKFLSFARTFTWHQRGATCITAAGTTRPSKASSMPKL